MTTGDNTNTEKTSEEAFEPVISETVSYLTETIKVTNNVNAKLNCVQWNPCNEWIAVGGEEGLLKILRLEPPASGKLKPSTSSTPPSPAMNQDLEAHSGQVQIIAWNEQHQKLTSTDDNGFIIVWVLYQGKWHEEMINNRNKSVVTGVAWNYDGQKICMVYGDGAVIVGTLDGSRIWGKELKKVGLSCVQWSPDSKYILFGIRNGEVHLYDGAGIFSMKIKIRCLPPVQVILQLAGLQWYSGKNGCTSENCPVLAIVYQSGHVQLMRDQYDEDPIILDTGMNASKCSWNHDGSILGIIGSTVLLGDNKETNVIQFFSCFGDHIQTLKLPDGSLSDFSWEGHSLKIALTIDSKLYIANIRPTYKWCYFSTTILFTYRSKNAAEAVVTFWDTKNNEIHRKTFKSLLSVATYKDHCVLAVETNDQESQTVENVNQKSQYTLMICNSLTTVVDTKCMDLKPSWVAMNSTHVFAASSENFLLWYYVTPVSRSSMIKISGARYKKERLYHVDDTPSGVAEVIQDLDKNFEESLKLQVTKDPICCIACSEKILLIGRKSGTVQRYTLPQVALVQRISLSSRPQCMAINCNSTKLSVIDCTGALSLITLQKETKDNYGVSKEESNTATRRDVWDMKWASDNAHYLAVMEKDRMYVLKDGIPEEPISSSAYIADFENLEIKAVLLDDVVAAPDDLDLEKILNFEVKSLRDTRQLLEKVGIPEATAFIEKNPHPRLWRLLAEAALQNLDATTAEMAYVRLNDYAGVQLIKKLANVQNAQMKKAMVACALKNYDEAEELYMKCDRRDLAIALREKLGDWFRVVELMKTGVITSDSQLAKAWNNIGDYFVDRANWAAAKEYFEKANNYEKLILCHERLDDYESLRSCISLLPEKHPLLQQLGEIFSYNGMCSEAVEAYSKFGAFQYAVGVCMELNQWDKALQLSNKHTTNVDVKEEFDERVRQLLQEGRILDTVQLFRKAGRFLEAAELLFEFANKQKGERKSPSELKRVHVLVGRLVESHIRLGKNQRSKLEQSSMKQNVIVSPDVLRNTKLLDNPWHDAEAYHFLMLCQRQLLCQNTEAALRTAIRLRCYDDVLDQQQTHCIIAVCAIACDAFEIASKAFTELETLETDSKEEYENIAVQIFNEHEPKDAADTNYRCAKCYKMRSYWQLKCDHCFTEGITCTGTGRIIDDINDAWQCDMCKHFTLRSEMVTRNTCPLCHSLAKL